tara:strand:- start:5245 stop:5925 length:681 start_codon:yes stop_codon:yes gene_type:complete
MLKDLIKLADHLDSKGLVKEADYLDNLINKSAQYTYMGGGWNPLNWGEALVDATSLGNQDLADAQQIDPNREENAAALEEMSMLENDLEMQGIEGIEGADEAADLATFLEDAKKNRLSTPGGTDAQLAMLPRASVGQYTDFIDLDDPRVKDLGVIRSRRDAFLAMKNLTGVPMFRYNGMVYANSYADRRGNRKEQMSGPTADVGKMGDRYATKPDYEPGFVGPKQP